MIPCRYFLIVLLFFLQGCYPSTPVTGEFPDFITANEDYFITRIGDVPFNDGNTYALTITELVENPGSFTLEDYWQDLGWDVTPPMDVDSTIFPPT